MQDKELDALFSNRLDDLEIEPSQNLWGSIAAELDIDKKKRSLLPYLSAAASIVVVITAGILFWPKVVKVDSKSRNKNQVAVKQVPAAVTTPETINSKEEPAVIPVVKSKPAVENLASAPLKKAKRTVAGQPKQEAVINEEKPAITEPEQAVLASVQQTNPAITSVVPDNSVPLTEKTISTEAEPFITKPVVMASASIPAKETQDTQPVKKKKINSFGGLLNALVSKIDKRKDKVIQFSDSDENHITGINLGIIKIKNNNDN